MNAPAWWRVVVFSAPWRYDGEGNAVPSSPAALDSRDVWATDAAQARRMADRYGSRHFAEAPTAHVHAYPLAWREGGQMSDRTGPAALAVVARWEAFCEIQAGPNPLTLSDIEALAKRHPERWAMILTIARKTASY